MTKEEIKVSGNPSLVDVYCPLPLHMIPDCMGINLCSVDSVRWVKQDDGQLVSITINFIPDPVE